MYLCKVFPSNRKKLKKRKCDLHEISCASPKRHIDVAKRRNSLCHAKPILGKIHVT